MSVSYTQSQKKAAKDKGLHLVTLAVAGMEFQGPATEDERDAVLRFLMDFLDDRRARLKAEKENTGEAKQ